MAKKTLTKTTTPVRKLSRTQPVEAVDSTPEATALPEDVPAEVQAEVPVSGDEVAGIQLPQSDDVEADADDADLPDDEAEAPTAPTVRTFTSEYELPASGFSDTFHVDCLKQVAEEAATAGFRVRGGARRSGFSRDGSTALYEVSVRRVEG